MNYDLEDIFVNHEETLQQKSSQEVAKAFLRAVLHLEIEFEFCLKKQIQVMKKVHRKNLQLTNTNSQTKPKKKVKKEEDEF